MKYEPIVKNDLRVPPILRNYDQSVANFAWNEAEKSLAYFSDGSLNIAHNVLDKHRGTPVENKAAMIWTDGVKEQQFTFADLIATTNKFANVLQTYGVEKGDRVFMFLPRIPELYTCFLGALKTGAIASNMFAAFGQEALQDRLKDSGAKVLVTNAELFERVKAMQAQLPELKHILIVDQTGYTEAMNDASSEFEVAHMKETDPAYMLYTSGTTGKPKGVVHCHGDIVQQQQTTKWVLDLKVEDIYWCTADPGWVTGVVYGIIGPWALGVTQVVYNGRFDPKIWYGLIEKHKVSVWYTAPTAVRMLMSGPPSLLHDFSSLRHIASVGEPLNPEAIIWAQKTIGLPIHDNYWQTETGSIVIANYPSMVIKPGSMGRPIPGVHAGIIDDEGKELPAGQEGNLALRPDFPSIMKSIWNNEEKFKSYFNQGWYLTGDRASKDEEGYIWFVGRADDVIKTAGERVGPFEVESALLQHPAVAEAGVIGKPDPLRGEIIKAFVKLKPGHEGSEELKKDLQQFMKKQLAGHAYPREIDFVDKLPKTRSGKIMRRVLKMKEMGQNVGDVSTMEEY
jgi:acetyl-CoA synthetase